MIDILGNAVIIIGLIFMFFGVFGLFRFKKFYPRALSASTIDTVGFICILTGIILKEGMNFFSIKIVLILIIAMIINPVATHSIVKSAYKSGYKEK
ncbi:monovalent cation/H(+) antiporter subunit G [Clostridium grantii]|uniref:Multisubunit sodium/proton antiporter, MrpG subunit n=1 Tax=Clostridium grantii DSM 8605 TaxID=1121316 RepID=A0A1M5RMG6_9CLOT|nr:monovalent cation/H(+) antiporter subunit G [Clostridium grantii]SHH27370.1 multisubunit sodium/proton antiporter, MrpG subunit [Clostridium grantii DSM 8605]